MRCFALCVVVYCDCALKYFDCHIICLTIFYAQEIGESAIMLGQLLGYDNKAERLAVLDAGLTVRGVEFAVELSALTTEAIDGFKVVKGVDPGLVKSMKEIDERIGLFLEKNQFQ